MLLARAFDSGDKDFTLLACWRYEDVVRGGGVGTLRRNHRIAYETYSILGIKLGKASSAYQRFGRHLRAVVPYYKKHRAVEHNPFPAGITNMEAFLSGHCEKSVASLRLSVAEKQSALALVGVIYYALTEKVASLKKVCKGRWAQAKLGGVKKCHVLHTVKGQRS